MEDHLSLLKSTFGQIVDIKEGNIAILQTLSNRIGKIKSIYSEFITANRDNLFVFTLDSFHFQGKLIDIEYEDMNRMFLSITNRMYCDYYKLFKIMIQYVHESIPDKKLAELIKVHDNYPVYKDLEPFKQYDFQYIQSLHEIILVILTYIHTYITNKEHDLKVYQSKNQIGLNIDSFVNTFSFNTGVMTQRAMLFINYMEFFHKTHTKYLKRFTTKLNLMLSQINNDIKLDTPEDLKNTKVDTINDLKEHNLDKKLMRELKVSISDDASTSSGKTPRATSLSDSGNEYEITINENVSDLSDDGLLNNNAAYKVKNPFDEPVVSVASHKVVDVQHVYENADKTDVIEADVIEADVIEATVNEATVNEATVNEATVNEATVNEAAVNEDNIAL